MKSIKLLAITSLMTVSVLTITGQHPDESEFIQQEASQNQSKLPLHTIIKDPSVTISQKHKILQKLLHDTSIDVNAQDADGRTAVNLLTFYQGDPSLINILVKEGKANVNIPDIFNQMPLHNAVAKNEINAIYILLDGGAETRFKNDEGLTPLDLARTDEAKEALGLEDDQEGDQNEQL